MLNEYLVREAGLYPVPQAELDEAIQDLKSGSLEAAARLQYLPLRPESPELLKKMNTLLLVQAWSSEEDTPAELVRPEVVELLPQAWLEEFRAVPLFLIADHLVTAVESVRDGLKLGRKVTTCLRLDFGLELVEVSRSFMDEAIRTARSIRRDGL